MRALMAAWRLVSLAAGLQSTQVLCSGMLVRVLNGLQGLRADQAVHLQPALTCRNIRTAKMI